MGNVAIMQVERYREAHAAVCAFRRLPHADELCRAERFARSELLGAIRGASSVTLTAFKRD
eukprot:7210-Chlamydomonas_euryale.AAC.1